MRAKVLKDCESVLKTVPEPFCSLEHILQLVMDWYPWLLVRLDLRGAVWALQTGPPAGLRTKLLLVTIWIHGVAMMGWKESRSSGRIWAFFSYREDLKSLMSGKGHKESHPSVGSGKNDSLSFYSSRYFSPSPFSQYVNAVTALAVLQSQPL